MAEIYMAFYLFYFETQKAKRYGRGSDVSLFYDICNQVLQSQNAKGRLVSVFSFLKLIQIRFYGVRETFCALLIYFQYYENNFPIWHACTARAIIQAFYLTTY